jgi:cytochrome o ubiquinol oxidase subunit IV
MSKTHNENKGFGKINLTTYLTGFILAIVLTLISFGLVIITDVPRQWAALGIIVAAVLQMLVHLHYFLHLDRSSSVRWNVVAIAFTVFMLIIFVGGTIWVMYTLNSRMM